MPLEKGPDSDEFFLTFDVLGGNTFARQEDPTAVIAQNDLDPASRIGLRTFDEIDATFGSVLGIDRTSYQNVDVTYQELRQSLPAVEDINTFLSSHQVAIAQLAIAYCDALIGSNANPNPAANTYFPGFNFNDPAVQPLIDKIMGTGLATQPAYADVHAELATFQAAGGRPDNLVDRLLAGGSDTRAISKGVCAAMLGSAATLIQ